MCNLLAAFGMHMLLNPKMFYHYEICFLHCSYTESIGLLLSVFIYPNFFSVA